MSTFHSAQIVWICKYVSSKFVLVSIPRLNSIKIKITPSDRFVGCQNNCIVVVNIFVLMFTLANFLTCSEGLLQFLLTKTRLTKPIIDNFSKKKKKNSKSDFNFQYYFFSILENKNPNFYSTYRDLLWQPMTQTIQIMLCPADKFEIV